MSEEGPRPEMPQSIHLADDAIYSSSTWNKTMLFDEYI